MTDQTTGPKGPDRPTDDTMPRADFLTSAVFVILGLAIVYFSWTMDRLEIRSVHPATVPGLVPGLLGALLAICGLLLGARSLVLFKGRPGWSAFFARFGSMEMLRFAVIAVLALVYTLVLVGLVPFWLATGLFVFSMIVAFEVWLNDEPKPLVRSMIWAAVQAVIVAAIVTAVFEYGFLVRLP